MIQKNTKNQTTSKYTEDWLPVKNINNGMIELENGEKVVGVKIKPRNIFILDQNSMNNVIINLKNFYNTINFEFWLICTDKPVDIAGYLAELQVLYNSVQEPSRRKLISQDIDKANNFIDNKVTDTEYYILFKEKKPDLINQKIRLLVQGLAMAGLESTPTSNNDLRTILDSFLNGGAKTEFGMVIG